MTRIIFLHGFPDNPEVWRYVVDHIGKRASCRTPELHSLKFEEQLARIDEMSLGVGQVILVGHDIGGTLACEYAQLYPEKVKRLLLVSSMGLSLFAHRLKRMDQLLRSSYMSVFLNPLVNELTLRPVATQFLNQLYNLGGLPSEDRLRQNGTEVLAGLRRYRELAFRVPKKLFEPDAPLLTPTDLIFGEKDPALLVPSEQELRRFYQNPTLHVMKGGHWPMRSHAEEFHALLDQLLF